MIWKQSPELPNFNALALALRCASTDPLPWKVRQRKLSGTKGRFLDMGGASGRREKRMNESRAGKKNRMSAWRSRICYKGVYEPREPSIAALRQRPNHEPGQS